ncbi:MAG: hypothetical protein K0Q79_3569 [Flavipsychrobacter sp.]|jgi:hypothetical protein|nr:hypothetical protein [Flavipsychrobacter sp.]
MVFAMHAIAIPAVKRKKTVVDTMIVIEVTPAGKGQPYTEVTFRRSARRYKLQAKANPNYVKLLKESADKHTPVLIERAKIESDEILSVKRVTKK